MTLAERLDWEVAGTNWRHTETCVSEWRFTDLAETQTIAVKLPPRS